MVHDESSRENFGGENPGREMGGDEVLRISCDDCVARATDVCADCVVTFLCSREPDDAVIIEVAEVRALQMLERGGLAPALRHRTG
jgi:hypothetical protein